MWNLAWNIFLFLGSLLSLLVSAALCFLRRNLKPTESGIYAVLGSGGHTGEMIRLIDGLDSDLRPTHYIIGHDDRLSAGKLSSVGTKGITMIYLSRPRAVGQSYWTSVVTSIKTFFECLHLFSTTLPRLILCNGPGICVIVTFASLTTATLSGRDKPKIVYVESFARCRSLSLSGQLMRLLASNFFVQWPQLSSPEEGYFTCKQQYIGALL